MKKRWIRPLILIFLVVLILTGLYLGIKSFHLARINTAPSLQDGLLDLSNWDFLKDGNVKLNGVWEFYPKELLSPADLRANSFRQSTYIKVPNPWNKGISSMPDRGAGTYRLKVKVNDDGSLYGLRTKVIRSSYKIFVNGKEAGSVGKPAASVTEGYETNIIPLTVFFSAEGEMLEIVIQVANFDFYGGGIIQSIYFGTEKGILSYDLKTNGFVILGISMLLMSGLYYLAIFINRRQDKRFLYIGLACIAYAFVTATSNEKIFNRLFEAMPFMLIVRAKWVMIDLSIVLMALFLREMSEAFIPKRFMQGICTVLGGNIILALVIPYRYTAMLEIVSGSLNVLVYVLIAGLICAAVRAKHYGRLNRRTTILLLVGIVLVILSFVSSLFFVFSINGDVLALLVMFLLLIGLAALFIQQYTNAYADLESMSLELIRTDKLKDEFLINTSHEFKTPLHGIIHMTQAVLNPAGDEDAAKQKENMAFVLSLATRLSNLVNDIMDFRSLKNGKLLLNETVFDISGVAQAVVEVLRYMRKSEEISLINAIPAGRCWVSTDEARFHQILVNLVSNSLKYTEKGYVELTALVIDGDITVSVKDTGIGINSEIQKQLFKGYLDAGEINFSDDTSSGMGLAISHMLALQMGGSLSLQWSEPQKGSCFMLRLPKADNEIERLVYAEENTLKPGGKIYQEEAVTQGEMAGAGEVDRPKLLIVDDDVSNHKVLREIFAADAYRVLSAYNGEKALELIRSHQDISLVLLDVMMPGLSGYEVCRNIRRDYSLFELPVVLLTVKNRAEDIAEGLDAGANDFLVKPFAAKELKARVKTLLKLRETVQSALKMETAFLQSQINPHFIYNSLSVIISLCYSDGERAGRLLEELSSYLRYCFSIDPYNAFISLRQEMLFVNAYVDLEKARFGNRLKVTAEIDELAQDYRIPAFIIQPIVENAIRHGLMKTISGGTVSLQITLEDKQLHILIKDDGAGMPMAKAEQLLSERVHPAGVGIRNTHQRLVNEYGQGLMIESEEGEGTIVKMVIPVSDQDVEEGGRSENESYRCG